MDGVLAAARSTSRARSCSPALDGEPTATILAEARRRGAAHLARHGLRRERALGAASRRASRICDLVTPGPRRGRGDHRRARARSAPRGGSRELGAGTAAVTLGADGCYARGRRLRRPRRRAVAVDAVDGTGRRRRVRRRASSTAGSPGWRTEACARFANAAGALATTAVGAFEGVADLRNEEVLA